MQKKLTAPPNFSMSFDGSVWEGYDASPLMLMPSLKKVLAGFFYVGALMALGLGIYFFAQGASDIGAILVFSAVGEFVFATFYLRKIDQGQADDEQQRRSGEVPVMSRRLTYTVATQELVGEQLNLRMVLLKGVPRYEVKPVKTETVDGTGFFLHWATGGHALIFVAPDAALTEKVHAMLKEVGFVEL